MNRLLSMLLLGVVLVGFSACKKAQEETAAAAKETVTEVKKIQLMLLKMLLQHQKKLPMIWRKLPIRPALTSLKR